MSSILDNIENTLNSTIVVDKLYEKYKAIDKSFLGVTLKREKSGYPYFEVDNARVGVVLINEACTKLFEKIAWLNITKTFPSWIEFRTKTNSYRKKYGGKVFVKMYVAHGCGHIQFGEDNNYPFADTKQFDNCYVKIKEGITCSISLERIFEMKMDKKYGYKVRPEQSKWEVF